MAGIASAFQFDRGEMERERRRHDRPVKRLRRLQSELEGMLRDAKALRREVEGRRLPGFHTSAVERDDVVGSANLSDD
jgi:hypothetical protein